MASTVALMSCIRSTASVCNRSPVSSSPSATAIMAIALSVADKNVTINNLLPGNFDTARLRSNLSHAAKRNQVSDAEAAARSLANIPAKRFGTPDEFGAACAFLCSAQAGYITGQNLVIDGGAFPGAF